MFNIAILFEPCCKLKNLSFKNKDFKEIFELKKNANRRIPLVLTGPFYMELHRRISHVRQKIENAVE